MIKEFKTFIMRGNMLDMAVGVILGAAFGKIIDVLVTELLMPPLGILIGGTDFSDFIIVLKEGSIEGPYMNSAHAKEAGAVVMSPGLFFNAIFSFGIIAVAIFFLVKFVNKVYEASEAAVHKATDLVMHSKHKQLPLTPQKEITQAPAMANKTCPYCYSVINAKAVKCPFCVSVLPTERSGS